MLRLVFFFCLVVAVALNALALFLGKHRGIGLDEIAICVSLVFLLFLCGIMAWRGKVFTIKGRWVWIPYEEDTEV